MSVNGCKCFLHRAGSQPAGLTELIGDLLTLRPIRLPPPLHLCSPSPVFSHQRPLMQCCVQGNAQRLVGEQSPGLWTAGGGGRRSQQRVGGFSVILSPVPVPSMLHHLPPVHVRRPPRCPQVSRSVSFKWGRRGLGLGRFECAVAVV